MFNIENILKEKSYAFALRVVKLAQSKLDCVNKLSVGLKEANETHYWLKLLNEGNYISETMFISIQPQAKELIKLLVASIKTAKENIKAD